MEKNTDLIIINAQNGDKAAFQELYQEVYKDLYHYALFVLKNKQDAEDVVADTVVDAFYSIKKLRSPASFKAWIFKILSSKVKQKLKEYARDKKEDIETIYPDLQDHSSMTAQVEIFSVLGHLPETEQQIVLLSIIGRYTSTEIGQILSLNAATVRSKLSRSLTKLRCLFTE
ncbi:MAG: RNA polymerase sigma factor [Clostridiales bacterium]|nr:RNA polymerase sigma factor [Clostridiales bacterium]